MPTYVIGGKKVRVDRQLSDSEIEQIAADLGVAQQPQSRQTKGGADEVPGFTNAQGQSYYDTVQPLQPIDATRQQYANKPVSMGEQLFGLGSPLGSFVKGAVVNPLLGANQLLANTGLFGDKVKAGANQLVINAENSAEVARERTGREGFDVAGLLGAIASPVNKVVPMNAATLPGRMAQGAGVGAVQAAITPTKTPENKLEDMAIGAALGGTFPALFQGIKNAGKVAKKLTEPLTAKGKENIVRAWFNTLMPADKEKAMEALRNADELVPGSKPTAAQALADIPESTALAANERAISGLEQRGISQKFAARNAEQQAAREAAIAQFAETPQALATARAAREADAMRNYGAAYSKVVKMDTTLARLAANPFFEKALPDAVQLAEAKGINAKTDLTQFLQFVKIGLDKELSKTGDAALSNAQRSAVKDVKSQLVSWMDTKNPDYAAARNAFAAASRPINQMEIGQYLQTALRSPLDVERAGIFAKAVQEAPKTIRKASGDVVSETLDQALTPKQAAAVRSVEADLLRVAKTAQNAKGTRAGGGDPDQQESIQLLNRWATIANFMLKGLKKGVNEELNAKIGDLLLNPKELASFLSAMPKEPGKSKAFAQALMKQLTPENQVALSNALRYQATEE